MWADLTYRLRRRLPEPGRLLGSWKLSIVLMVIAAEYHVLLAVWAARTPSHVVQNIAGLAPFWIAYALLLVNTAVCLWQRWPALRADVDPAPMELSRRARWEASLPPETTEAALRRRLRGYRLRGREAGGLWGLRRRWAAVGTYVFHLAFFLVASGFLLTLAARHETRLWVAEGETYEGAPDQILSASGTGLVDLGIPDLRFQVKDIRPEFWRDQLLFTRLEADLVLPDGGERTVRINDPLWLGWGTFVRLSSVGYAPRYEVLDREGRVVSSAFVKMNLFPPGQRDFLVPEGLPHRVYLRLWPDWPDGVEDPSAGSMNLVAPRLEVRVLRGQVDLGGAELRPGEAYGFEGLRLRFPELRYWGELTVVRDPGAVVLFSGFALALVGLLLKVRGKRAEVVWAPGPGGRGGVLRGYGAAPEPLDEPRREPVADDEADRSEEAA